jgi:hypothetical protein
MAAAAAAASACRCTSGRRKKLCVVLVVVGAALLLLLLLQVLDLDLGMARAAGPVGRLAVVHEAVPPAVVVAPPPPQPPPPAQLIISGQPGAHKRPGWSRSLTYELEQQQYARWFEEGTRPGPHPACVQARGRLRVRERAMRAHVPRGGWQS